MHYYASQCQYKYSLDVYEVKMPTQFAVNSFTGTLGMRNIVMHAAQAVQVQRTRCRNETTSIYSHSKLANYVSITL